MGLDAMQSGDLAGAESIFSQVLRAAPEQPDALHLLGMVAQQAGDLEFAAEHLRRAVRAAPANAQFHNNYGTVLRAQQDLDGTARQFELATQLDPASVLAFVNRGAVSEAQGRLESAIEQLERALEIEPKIADAHNNLAVALERQGRTADAIEHFECAVTHDPLHRSAHSNLLLSLHYGGGERTAAELLAEHRRWSELQEAPLARERRPHANERDRGRALRIGYVSADLRSHSVAYFVEPLLEAHSEDFEITCYADVAAPDAVTERLRGLAGRWRSIAGMSDEQVAEQVREDVDPILAHLGGHTPNNRLLVFARKPAPVQVTYVGYPGTTGLDTIDYRITDARTDPDGVADVMHSERLVRLPSGFNCYRAPDAPEPAVLPALTAGHVTFGSFNHLPKVTPQAIATWARILERVPGARLLLKASSLADGAARRRVLAAFAEHGIGEHRVELLARVDSQGDHLTLYGRIDVALDTFPYNGATTTCEAMWMGVPVVTLAGESHAGRVGVSLLHRVGLDDLVASDLDGYVDAAAGLAGDRERLGELRSGLRARMRGSSLCDAQAVTREHGVLSREVGDTADRR